MIKTNKHYIK